MCLPFGMGSLVAPTRARIERGMLGLLQHERAWSTDQGKLGQAWCRSWSGGALLGDQGLFLPADKVGTRSWLLSVRIVPIGATHLQADIVVI